MSRTSPLTVRLSPQDRAALEARARKYSLPYRDVLRAKIVLLAAEDLPVADIARRLDTPREIVWKWRRRFLEEGLAGLEERPVGAGPAPFPPLVVVEVKALACQFPTELGVPLSRLHVPDIRSEVMRRGIVARVSDSTSWRWLSEDAIRPWTFRSWIFPRDPDFEPKAARVLDLYVRRWEGTPLDRKSVV